MNNSHDLRDHFSLITRVSVTNYHLGEIVANLYQGRTISEKAEWSLKCSSPVGSSEASSAPIRAGQMESLAFHARSYSEQNWNPFILSMRPAESQE